MTKFVFRSLAREHPEPGDFLSRANEVAVGEIAAGKFVTMALPDDRPGERRGRVAERRAPAPRLVGPTARS